MLAMMLKSGGVAERSANKAGGNRGLIPAGINLGGFCMMRMPNTILFFHRMKLRNDTQFRIQYLHNDLENMVLRARISLNDLHLIGSYDRTITDKNPSDLFYVPTFGQAEFMLKNVRYIMEGRYRLLSNRLNLVLTISEIQMDDILMEYQGNVSSPPIRLDKRNIDTFMDRLKIDLNQWLKDYFNDYLMYFGLSGRRMNPEFQKYDKEKSIALNDFTDNAINVIIRKLHQVKAGSVRLPKFTIYAINGMQLHLRDGVIRGLDSIYRRSIATGVRQNDIRKIDAFVGFSNLKVTYSYDATVSMGAAPLSGTLTLSANDLVAHISLSMVKDPESVDLEFEYIQQAAPESLTIEGPANRMISHFKFLLERHIIAIMSNTLIHNIKMLSTLSRCVPILVPKADEAATIESDEYNDDNHKLIEHDKSFDQVVDTKSNEKLAKKHSNTNMNADYVLWKKDSVELEFPPKRGSKKKQKMFLKYNEKFALGKIN
ncbi:uncharacterized protein LOC123696343 [Colias croceus]|uniref:uncharacterized protein LOC123696343 n=1 Tax=Colias crocea TaxID=72248 RepID=UPI001E281906|nr:uncharacterized protein LOC123696343 [Colias croceus]